MKRVYVKLSGEKRFRPLDLQNCVPVGNLIYASLINDEDADKVLKDLRENNSTMKFEARTVH